jgi:hypothetical protein
MDKMTPESLRNAIHQVAGEANAPFTPPYLMTEGVDNHSDELPEGVQKDIVRLMDALVNEARTISSPRVQVGRKAVLRHLRAVVLRLGEAVRCAGDEDSANVLEEAAKGWR